jgi:tRNA pseudouridine55 synthase
MAETPLPIDGLLIVDKPAGWTSHDVVGRLRRLTGVRRIGHAGTLDPLATGVLPLGIGQGTRVLEYIGDAEKRYVATVELGATTDTYDAAGAVVERRDWFGVTEAAVRRVLAGFLGTVEQRPPAYSAIKQGGVPLYRLARAGEAVTAPLRTVTIHSIDAVDIRLPHVSFAVTCSKGTYIRSLAHDLGERLGCGGHLVALRRTATGGFTIEQAVTIERFEQALADGSWPSLILPADLALIDRPALILGPAAAARLRDGVAPAVAAPALQPGALGRAYGDDGSFLGVVRWRGGDGGWKAEKVLVGR